MCCWLSRVVFGAVVELPRRSALEPALESAVHVSWVEVHFMLCVFSVSADVLQCMSGKEGIQAGGFDEASPGVFLWQPASIEAH
jgi:hypothetical protein